MHGYTINYNCFNEDDFMFGFDLYISYPNIRYFRLIKTCKGPIKISKGPLILGSMHVFGIFAVVPFKTRPSFGLALSLPY